MNRRNFAKSAPAAGSVPANLAPADFYGEPPRRLSARRYDVLVAGGGTAGAVAAIAAARQGARTLLVESKGYAGGTVVEGSTALHSFYNLWKAFPGVEKRNVVRGIPKEIVDRLLPAGGTCGYPEMERNFGYDSVGTAVDTEIYKLVAHEMLAEAGVTVAVNTLLAGAVRKGARIEGVITESRAGREMIRAQAFVDSTGYGDLSAQAGAKYTEPNDYPVCNSMGLANVNVEKLHRWLKSRDAVAKAELELRRRQYRSVELFRTHLPECERAFIARTSPSLNIRRGRLIACDYDITRADVLEARHFDDDVMAYGFHDLAPRLQIRNGGAYGIPYRALRVAGLENLLAAGMLITSNHDAHMSTRNTVCSMGQGQAAGTAAALCAAQNRGTRDLRYGDLRKALERGGVCFES